MDKYEQTFHVYNKIASAYQDKFMDLDLYDDTYDLFCTLIQKINAKVFEIACGPGNITKYLLTKRPDFKIEAIDIAPKMIELAKINNPSASFKVMDCRKVDQLNSKFDGILCGFCMPYLSKEDCAKLIKDASLLLNPAGILYFSTIEGDYSKSTYETNSKGEDPVFVYYHQEDYLQENLKEYRFISPIIIRKTYHKADGSTSTHIIFIAKKR